MHQGGDFFEKTDRQTKATPQPSPKEREKKDWGFLVQTLPTLQSIFYINVCMALLTYQ